MEYNRADEELGLPDGAKPQGRDALTSVTEGIES